MTYTGTRMALLGSGLLVNLINFSVYPYLAVLLRHRMDLGMDSVGIILGCATLVQFAGGLPGAALAERFGLQRSLVLAMVLQTLGSLGFLAGGMWPALTIAALFLRAASSSVYSPAVRGYTILGAAPQERAQLVSASYATGNVGIALGPVVGALFIHDPGVMFLVATVLHVTMTIGHALLPPDRRENVAVVEPLRRALHGLAALPFVVTTLTLYLHMHFYQYLSPYAEGRVPTVFFGSAMMAYSLILVVVQPLISKLVERMRYTYAMALGFGGLAAGTTAFTGGNEIAIAAGVLAIGTGNSVLFLKNVLEGLDRTNRSATVVFGQQRLAEGIGAFLSGLAGGGLYHLFESTGQLSGFWLAVAAQCLLLPAVVLLVARSLRRPVPETAGAS
ncbi:MFS transporter [Micromonospora sp. LOL_024]|uniref:MFS transporter n=1 Tax=Micromonospora sp. LOL_024 TaxID=3345412 RepID=UPI003A8370E4